MATIQFGTIITDARGKSGGNQFSKTRAGNLLQVKGSQRKGATPQQGIRRSVFSFISRSWRGLTDAERLANNSASINYPYIDKFGNTRYYSGFQLYVRSNSNLFSANLPLVNVVPSIPPAGVVLDTIVATSEVNALGELSMFVTYNPAMYTSPDYTIFVSASPPVSQGLVNYTGRFTHMVRGDLLSLNLDMDPFYVVTYGVPAIGGKVFYEMKIIDNTSGIEVAAYSFSSTVVLVP